MKIWALIAIVLFMSCQKEESTGNQQNTILNRQLNTLKMDLQYAYTILYVKDVPKTIKFYEKSFGFRQKMLTPEKDYGEIKSGATTIAFANFELGKSNFKSGFQKSSAEDRPFGIELALTTSDVEKGMENALKNGAVLLEEMVTKPWGQQVGYIRDINGFIIEICTPIQDQE